jgi:23S rRNA pseudouridine1911/1915/1917 synthase
MAFMSLPARILWVVRPGDGSTVGEILSKAGADEAAIREGRVFVGRVRADDGAAMLEIGEVVTIAPSRPEPAAVRVLADEEGIVAVEKPAGMPTIPDQEGSAHSLLVALATTLACDTRDLHPTSRLDHDVSGVVLFTRTPEAAERLATARKEGTYYRRYVAIASRTPDPEAGAWDAPIGRAKDPRRRLVRGRDAVPARSLYTVVARAGTYSMLALEPITGRTHQLRVHAADAGAALLGDGGYGGDTRVVLSSGRVLGIRRIALHAARVVVPRRSGEAMEVRAEVPEDLRGLWTALGGVDDAWNAGLLPAFRASVEPPPR